MTHCDDVIDDSRYPECLRKFLAWQRMPAVDKLQAGYTTAPKCFAMLDGEQVRLTMASRFGDIGVAADLDREHGYDVRVDVGSLSLFAEDPA